MTNLEPDLDTVKINQRAKYLGQGSFYSNVPVGLQMFSLVRVV